MKKVVILESLGIPAEELKAFQAPFAGEVEFEEFQKTTDIPALIEEAKDADAMIIANMPMPGEVISACEKLQFIDVAFTGVDHVGLDAAKAKGIKVSNASGYSNEAVSELVIGMVLSMMRNIPAVQERVRSGGTKDGLVGCELAGKTVGIIGFGNIGRRTGALMHAFGCKVLAQSRTIHSDFPEYAEQVTAEHKIKVKGRPAPQWVPKTSHADNHYLDCEAHTDVWHTVYPSWHGEKTSGAFSCAVVTDHRLTAGNIKHIIN